LGGVDGGGRGEIKCLITFYFLPWGNKTMLQERENKINFSGFTKVKTGIPVFVLYLAYR
jgi:hypothetical protein